MINGEKKVLEFETEKGVEFEGIWTVFDLKAIFSLL
jgi:hypothetical protein